MLGHSKGCSNTCAALESPFDHAGQSVCGHHYKSGKWIRISPEPNAHEMTFPRIPVPAAGAQNGKNGAVDHVS